MKLQKTLLLSLSVMVGMAALPGVSEAVKNPLPYHVSNCEKLKKEYNALVKKGERLETGLHALPSAYDVGISAAEKRHRIILKNTAVNTYNEAWAKANAHYKNYFKDCRDFKGIIVQQKETHEGYNSWIKPVPTV